MIDTFLVTPLLNALIFLYSLVPGHDFGLAVILLTIVIRVFLWPLAAKALRSQKKIQELQPEIEKLKKKHKDKQQLSKAMMELYKEKKVNPLGSCLPALLQLPLMLGLFWAFLKLSDPAFVMLGDASQGIQAFLYSSVAALSFVKETLGSMESINTTLYGLVDLAKPSIALAAVASGFQYVQSKMLMPKKPGDDPAQKMMRKMIYFFPVLTFVFGAILPAALPLYWLITTLVAIIQQYLVMHRDVSFMEHLKRGLKKEKA